MRQELSPGQPVVAKGAQWCRVHASFDHADSSAPESSPRRFRRRIPLARRHRFDARSACGA